MYLPPNTVVSARGHVRAAFIGFPGTGKTTCALTFPNIIAADFDHKLPPGINTVPFWDSAFVDSIVPRTKWRKVGEKGINPPNRRDAFALWLRENHSKFTPEQTLLIDSWTMLDNAFQQQIEVDPILNSKMEPDPRAGWGYKLSYFTGIMNDLKACHCNVVVTCHETEKTDREGDVLNKLRPIMTGSFRDQLLGHFNVAFRCVVNPQARNPDGTIQKDANGRPKILPGFYWQGKSDELFDVVTEPGLVVKDHYIGPSPTYATLMSMYQS